jgi:exopolyphosphatase/guanosine-5'-triphosphate,3'-diphosphate pyrophosphatase
VKETTVGRPIVAVIDIGSSAMRMVVAEVGPKMEIRYLENLQKPVRFGKDVFATGRLSSEALREALGILRDFRRVLEEYGVSKVQAVATSAVREAANRDNFLDRIYVQAGIDVEVIEGAEQNRLELIAVEHALEGKIDLSTRSCLILEVGSGSTELIRLHHGRVEATRTLSLGSARLPDPIAIGRSTPQVIQRTVKRVVHDMVAQAEEEFRFTQIDTFIAVGADVRFAAHRLEESGPAGDERHHVLPKATFVDFVMKLAKTPPEDLSAQFGLPYLQAETLFPALLIYVSFLAETPAENLIVPLVSIRDGILLEAAQMLSGYRRTDVSRQVLHSAHHLGEKYSYDKPHAVHVAGLAVKLFDALKEEHGMGSRERLLLEVAAIVHDIGVYVSPMSHHKHGSYLIDAAEIFGLRRTDKAVVSNVVRYHRRSGPKPTHVAYMSLPKSERAVVSKLAALLRVADALDRNRQQRIRAFTLERSEEACTICVPEDAGDISLDKAALESKGNLFSDVFGLRLHLVQGAQASE